jgi:hypothetical protein
LRCQAPFKPKISIMSQTICRLAIYADIENILTLQEKYLFANLNEQQRLEGFVTTPFTEHQIATLIVENGAFVAYDQENLVAYTFAAGWEFFAQWPIFPYMVSRLPLLDLESMPITSENSYQYGPICVDKSHRGLGVFEQIFALMQKTMQRRYPIGVTFINQVNEPSYRAHTKKLKMKVIDKFHFNERNYYGLAFFS